MPTPNTQKYPKFQEVASDPKDQIKITDFLEKNPAQTIAFQYPIELEDGTVEFFTVTISN